MNCCEQRHYPVECDEFFIVRMWEMELTCFVQLFIRFVFFFKWEKKKENNEQQTYKHWMLTAICAPVTWNLQRGYFFFLLFANNRMNIQLWNEHTWNYDTHTYTLHSLQKIKCSIFKIIGKWWDQFEARFRTAPWFTSSVNNTLALYAIWM